MSRSVPVSISVTAVQKTEGFPFRSPTVMNSRFLIPLRRGQNLPDELNRFWAAASLPDFVFVHA